MRLVCPNCDATYEVPDSVIPPEGRDVQCSNCGTSWFFNPAFPEPLDAEIDPEPEVVEARPAHDAVVETSEPELEPAPETRTEPEPEPDPEPIQVSAPPPPPPEPKRRGLEPDVANVLREEAEFEAKARAEEELLEIQDILPLDDPPPAPEPEVDEVAVAAVAGSRRDLLPDIDEINSTLRPASDRKADGTAADAMKAAAVERRQGFRIGFGGVALVLGLLAALYGFSERVIEIAPGMRPFLDSYVASINEGRVWLEEAIGRLVENISAES